MLVRLLRAVSGVMIVLVFLLIGTLLLVSADSVIFSVAVVSSCPLVGIMLLVLIVIILFGMSCLVGSCVSVLLWCTCVLMIIIFVSVVIVVVSMCECVDCFAGELRDFGALLICAEFFYV